MKKNIFILLTLFCILNIGCAGMYKPELNPNKVKIGHNWLSPSEIIIMQGMTVTWVNTVSMPEGHSIINIDEVFKSRPLKEGESFTYRFEQPGVYEYYLKEHPKSIGRVIVEHSYALVNY